MSEIYDSYILRKTSYKIFKKYIYELQTTQPQTKFVSAETAPDQIGPVL